MTKKPQNNDLPKTVNEYIDRLIRRIRNRRTRRDNGRCRRQPPCADQYIPLIGAAAR